MRLPDHLQKVLPQSGTRARLQFADSVARPRRRRGRANFPDCGVNALVNVHENVFAPERAGDLLAGYELSFVFDQEHQQLKRQSLKANGLPWRKS